MLLSLIAGKLLRNEDPSSHGRILGYHNQRRICMSHPGCYSSVRASRISRPHKHGLAGLCFLSFLGLLVEILESKFSFRVGRSLQAAAGCHGGSLQMMMESCGIVAPFVPWIFGVQLRHESKFRYLQLPISALKGREQAQAAFCAPKCQEPIALCNACLALLRCRAFRCRTTLLLKGFLCSFG